MRTERRRLRLPLAAPPMPPCHVVISQEPALLKFRSIGLSDYAVLEGSNRIGRIRFADERRPGVWLWSVTVPLPGDLPTGSSPDFNTDRLQGCLGSTEG
jgi:hypothetical protein